MKEVTIVGSGFSGMSLGYYLAKRGLRPIIYEKTRVGGLISTQQTSCGIIESAANGLINSTLVEELFDELGIEILPMRKQAKARFVFHQRAQRWPLSWYETLSFLGKVIGSLGLRRRWAAPRPMETMLAWGTRCFGRTFSERLLAPALFGIYASDAQELSASLIAGRFFSKSSKRGPQPKQKGTVSAPGGMGELIDGLRRNIEQRGGVFMNEAYSLSPDSPWPVVLATSAKDAHRLCQNSFPQIAAQLKEVQLLPIVTITSFFKENDGVHGFGVLFAKESPIQALGALMNEQIFSDRSQIHSETWIYGGDKQNQVAQLTDLEILNQLREDRQKAFRSQQAPIDSYVTRWPEAIPHYSLHLEKVLNDGFQLPQGLYLHGNYLGHLGLAKILERSKDLSQKIYEDLA